MSPTFIECFPFSIQVSLNEALEYRQKVLPTLETTLSEKGSADSASMYDLFCWITDNDVVFSQLQEAVSFVFHNWS